MMRETLKSSPVRHLLVTAVVLLLDVPVIAQVDPMIHKLCIEAKDYAGCVRTMSGSIEPGSRQVNSQGADIAEGNQCPDGFAYIGGGNCREVTCGYGQLGGHDPRVAGKLDASGKNIWGCKYNFWLGAGTLELINNATTRTSFNKECPVGVPRLGYNSTCDTAGNE